MIRRMIKYGAQSNPVRSAARRGGSCPVRAGSQEYFIFVGRLVPEKGVHELVKAYKRLNTEYPLVIIGDDRTRPRIATS
jgi:glycosyltransferase involved in cell wall biosynthesis